MTQSFVTTITQGRARNVTGIVVPPKIIAGLGPSKRPAVRVTLNGYTYSSTVGTMDGRFMISLSAAHREAARLRGGDKVKVTLELDTQPRVVVIPADLRDALLKEKLLARFETAAPSRRKGWVRLVEDAKSIETRERRIRNILDSLIA